MDAFITPVADYKPYNYKSEPICLHCRKPALTAARVVWASIANNNGFAKVPSHHAHLDCESF